MFLYMQQPLISKMNLKTTISKKVVSTFLLFFLFSISFAQSKKTCEILTKTIEKYASNVNAFKVNYIFQSGSGDTSRFEGNLYYNNTIPHQPPYYILEADDNIHTYFNNKNYYGCNNSGANKFTDFLLTDSTKLLKRNLIRYMIPAFLMYHPFLKDYIEGCNTKTVVLKETNESYIISIADSTLCNGVADGVTIGTSNYDLALIEIDKKTFLIKKHYSELDSKVGGVISKQIDELRFTQLPILKEAIIAKIDNEKPLANRVTPIKDSLHKSAELGSFPSFKLKDMNNTDFTDDLIKSRYVLVEFWYKSCAPCILNLQQLNKIDSMYSKTDLTILAVNDVDTGLTNLSSFIKKFNLTYPVLYRGKSLADTFHFYSHPQTFIYDNKDRKIVFSSMGGSPNYAADIKIAFDGILKKETNSFFTLLIIGLGCMLVLITVFVRLRSKKI